MGSQTARVTLTVFAKRQLWSESGGYCQNPGCAEYLFADGVDMDFAEMAHVIPASPDGPRDVPLDQTTLSERAHPSNIIVLCANCHTIVDKAPAQYPAEMLLAWKKRRFEQLRTAVGTPRFDSRFAARSHIEPLLAANRAVHSHYGPSGDPYVEGNPPLWRRHARSTVVPNNREILRILNANQHLLTDGEKQTVALYTLHVEEFESRHVLGDWSTGTQIFPPAMAHILTDEPVREDET
jgi:hypothetical protein